MQSLVTPKVTTVNATEAQNEHAMRALTNEEILAVAGGPEVDVEAGGGGG